MKEVVVLLVVIDNETDVAVVGVVPQQIKVAVRVGSVVGTVLAVIVVNFKVLWVFYTRKVIIYNASDFRGYLNTGFNEKASYFEIRRTRL
jgi:hypothetical protein